MTALLRWRWLEADECPEARPRQRRSFDDALKQALLKTYPVAPVVEGVDDVLERLLEKIATLEMDRKRED